ncbi:unnamed protein product [Kuraishia capsulata CBS 1993]|uniref:25S rRNA adenine-N(1) methyltransferase n=1 Tax=Kuraishia capsulata CBS 1993 TaxID=1382522 RepID=W6MPL7_9ASCO|nr:uncharacterized protein KUCA_T00004643001 [Kuraishia capsulata CBS 1993]CDK28659.1 unnamed protein product [Kuraishia capsulata CBS 1993]
MGLLNRKRVTGITEKSKNQNVKVRNIKPEKARKVIRSFHTLRKNRSKLINDLTQHFHGINEENYMEIIRSDSHMKSVFENQDKLSNIDAKSVLVGELGKVHRQMESQGGLELYQLASTLGQQVSRGGDSSRKLIEWLKELNLMSKGTYRALEIGSLSSKNVISTCGLFQTVTRVDLHSQEPEEIIECDFMEFAVPKEEDRYDLVSCSLVLNFVPTPIQRGDMLRRIRLFFTESNPESPKLLFMVLPLPCITNSRYLDNSLLLSMMSSLGFKQLKYHEATKVVYWLWEFDKNAKGPNIYRSKKEVRSGKNRNNFSILL